MASVEAALLEIVAQNKEAVALGLLVIAAVGLTWRQRKAIRDRDDNECQSDDDSIRHGGRLEVDHIIPKGFAEEALKMTPDEYNNPTNLITKCLNHHRGHPKSHHPDMHQAWVSYQEGDHQAINRALGEHERKARSGMVYWNNENDGRDRKKARMNTGEMDKKMGGRKKWWPG